MYLLINGTRHTVSKRIVTKDTIKYLSVTPDPVTVSGAIQLFRDDGFLMAEDNADGFERQSYTGTLLTLTNAPEPTPEDPTTKPEYRLSVLEEENKAIKDQLSQADDTAIELYEANLAQQEINTAQDDALIELFEMIGGQ